jgi:hypothetical protein
MRTHSLCDAYTCMVSWFAVCSNQPLLPLLPMLHAPLPPLSLQMLVADYLAKPADWLTELPAKADVVRADAPRPLRGVAGGRSGGMGPGAIAGAVIGAVAGAAILASLAYFVGYKKLYLEHKSKGFVRGELPDGPMHGVGAYPSATIGAGSGAPGIDVERPGSAAVPR